MDDSPYFSGSKKRKKHPHPSKTITNIYSSDPFASNNVTIENLTGLTDKDLDYMNNKKRKNVKVNIKNLMKNPAPNYIEFDKPEYIDTSGIEYKLASGAIKESYQSRGEITNPDFKEPDDFDKRYIGTQVFWIRMPIKNRGNTEYPNPLGSGQSIRMYHIEKQILCEASVDSVFVGNKRKTGYVVLRDFRTLSQPNDPKEYLSIVNKKYTKKYLS